MKNLMIVESPTKVKSIEKFLGPDFKVIASVGHVRDLVSSARKGIDVDQGFKPVWKVSNNKKTVIDDIKKFTKDADVIYFATDPDREGEFIAWRLKEILSDFDSIQRISFNEITKDAVMSAISEPRDVDMDLVNAAIVRRLIDRLVGWRCSKFCKSWKLKSMGRVQTPTLGFIVEKELERDNHVPKEYHSVSVPSNGIEMNVRFHESDDPNAWLDDDEYLFCLVCDHLQRKKERKK